MKPLVLSCSFMLVLAFAGPGALHAGSATWSANPATRDWNTAGNWAPNTVPNGPADTAIFASSNNSAVSLTGLIEAKSIAFSSGASAFTVTSDPAGSFSGLSITGLGIVNNSGIEQNFVALTDPAGGQGTFIFTNSASAGALTTFTNRANPVAGVDGGITDFVDKTSAGSALFINEGATSAEAPLVGPTCSSTRPARTPPSSIMAERPWGLRAG